VTTHFADRPYIEIAQALPNVTAELGHAKHLALADDSFDADLLLGPLYHLTDRDDRIRAWCEIARVVRPAA